MSQPPKIKFHLLNNLSLDEVKNSNYVVYAHSCPSGLYVGFTKDPVHRWHEHYDDAFNKHSPYYNAKLKAAIRKYSSTFEHYIIAVSKFENQAKNKEAAAIIFYSSNLNMKKEVGSGERDYRFVAIDKQHGIKELLSKKSRAGGKFHQSDSDSANMH